MPEGIAIFIALVGVMIIVRLFLSVREQQRWEHLTPEQRAGEMGAYHGLLAAGRTDEARQYASQRERLTVRNVWSILRWAALVAFVSYLEVRAIGYLVPSLNVVLLTIVIISLNWWFGAIRAFIISAWITAISWVVVFLFRSIS
jgi:hypothetical protein